MAKLSSKPLSDLRKFCRSIDDEVESLQKEVHFAVVGSVSGSDGSQLSADAADQVLDEVRQMKIQTEGRVVLRLSRLTSLSPI
jgi:predicted transcriptional regulator